MTKSHDVASIRSRRESLLRAAIGLEDALASPVGDGERWRLRVAMATDHATARIDQRSIGFREQRKEALARLIA